MSRQAEYVLVPNRIFQDRQLSVLEALVAYLKEQGFSFHEIGQMLNRDERTIWTCHHRMKKKREIHGRAKR